jgi:DNA-binding Lrp family transcriptional regulator
MNEVISMSIKELDRLKILEELHKKQINQKQAADSLGLSARQIRRLIKSYKAHGAIGIVSKKRGKAGNRQLPKTVKDLVLALIEANYADFGPTLAQEKLSKLHNLRVSVSLVRSLMINKGLWKERKKKKENIHQLRERRSKEGELIHVDTSPHAWFEDRGIKCGLLLSVDDATSKIMNGHFAPSEALWPYFELIHSYISKYGRMGAIYCDKHSVFRINREGALSGEGITQFGRAMKELDIKMIYANSPQAKGRVERANRTLQDRLVKELRLRDISTIEEANAFLPEFIEEYNKQFAVIPKSSSNAHRPVLKEQNLDLIFTIQTVRTLSKNLTFQYKNTIYQVIPDKRSLNLRKAKILVKENKKGTIEVLYKEYALEFVRYQEQAKQGAEIDAKNLNQAIDQLTTMKTRYKPAYHHPWKRSPGRKIPH